jgi:hypothetical protein
MVRKRHTAEEIVAKLRQVDVLTSQGRSVAEPPDRTQGVFIFNVANEAPSHFQVCTSKMNLSAVPMSVTRGLDCSEVMRLSLFGASSISINSPIVSSLNGLKSRSEAAGSREVRLPRTSAVGAQGRPHAAQSKRLWPSVGIFRTYPTFTAPNMLSASVSNARMPEACCASR